MATRVASLFAEIGLKTDKFNADMNKVKGELGKVGNEFKTLGKNIKASATGFDDVVKGLTGFSLAQIGAAGAATYLISQMASSVREAEDAAKAQAQLEAVIISTGQAAGLTSNDINLMSMDLSKLTGVEDDLIIKNSALMLTFKEVGKDVFPQAMKAAADMSAVIGQDLQSSVIQLGKALNNPIEGITALKRVGVSFTSEQEAMIKGLVKSGNMMQAQKLVLAELESEFGGAAEAMHEAGTGSDDLRNSIGNLKESIGEGLIPTVRNANAALVEWIDTTTQGFQIENDLLAAAKKGIITQTQANNMITIGTWTAKGRAQAQAYLNKKTEEYNKLYQRSLPVIKNFNIAEAEAIDLENNMAIAKGMVNTELEKSIGIQESHLGVLEDIKSEYEDLSTVLGGTMGQATRDFRASMYDLNQEAIVLQDNIDNLEGKKYLTESQKASLAEAKTRLGENQTEVKKLAEEHDKASKQIILGFVQQAAAADGVITQQEFDKIAELGKAWGLYDEETATAIANSKAYLEDGGMSVDELTGKINTTSGSINTAIGKTRNFAEELAKLKDKTITITVKTKGNLGASGGILAGGPGGAHGLDMVVPPGHPNDSFPVFATSGERVTITPPGNKGAGGGNTFGDINIFVDGGDADATADAVFSRFSEATRAASNAGIGFAG